MNIFTCQYDMDFTTTVTDYFNMADPRMGTHQQFDALRCRLCNNIYNQPKLLACLHSFCEACLEKYEAETADISANQIACPMCKEKTELPCGVKDLTDNTLIQRYIAQVHRDKTQMVAGREVLALQRQALTESDLSCPEIVSSIQQIADTAGHIIAGGIEEQSQVHDFDTVKTRQDLTARTAHLQEKALDIVSSIDHVNTEAAEWSDNRAILHDKIKHRSAEIQNIVQGIERKLLARLDDKQTEIEMKNTFFGTKTTLHKTLKSDLTTVEFMKLLREFGDAHDLKMFMPIVEHKEKSILENAVTMKVDSYMFEHPTVDIREGVEMMFGGLTHCTEEKTAWDPKTSRRTRSTSGTNDSSPASDIESHFQAPKRGLKPESNLLTNYTEVNENGDLLEDDDPHVFSSRFSKRFEQSHSKPRRRPLKSNSFDAGVMASPLLSTHSKVLQQTSHDQPTNNNDNDNDDNSNSDVKANIVNENEDYTHSMIQGLHPNSERKSWARRVSAPSSMIIDTLNRRRLNALSILERANIRTEGLNMTSDVESGLSEARLEWLRDNFHRRNGSKQSSLEEEV